MGWKSYFTSFRRKPESMSFVIVEKGGIHSFVIPAKAGIHLFVIPAEAGIQLLIPSFPRKRNLATLILRFVAITDSRPCVARRASLPAGYFLLLAQEKVTKEKGTLGAAPAAKRPVREGRPGSIDRPSLACDRMRAIHRAPSRALHAADPSGLRRVTEGPGRAKSGGALRVFLSQRR
jgi:hypothetical protein